MESEKREYRVLLGTTITKEVRVMAHNAKEAATVIYGALPEGDELGGVFGTESVGHEFVVEVVRVGQEFRADRLGGGDQ